METRHLPIPIINPRRPVSAPGADEQRGSLLSGRLATPFSGDSEATARVSFREGRYRRFLALTDSLCATLACVTAIVLMGDDRLQPATLALLPLVVFTSKVLGLYDRDELLIRKTTADEVPALFQLATVYALVIWLAGTTFVDGDLSRRQVFGLWGILFVAMVLGRWAIRAVLARTTPAERCLVVGSPDLYQRFSDKVADNPMNVEVVGRVALERWAGRKAGAWREVHALRQTLSDLQVDRVVIVPDDEPEVTLDLIRAVKSLGVRVSVLPHVLEVVGSAVAYDDVFGLPVLGLRRFGLTRSSQIVKRILDIFCSGLSLVVMAIPLAIIAVIIKRDSPGPVFFVQERTGRDGLTFRMIKFRSMVVDAEGRKAELDAQNETDGLFKITNDPRVTPFGHHLRRLSLDELPQLINVLRGDMSMVGPRPLVLDEDHRIEGLDRRRLILTPGITGPWQILSSGRVPMGEMVKIDYLYAATWSMWGDIKILLRTVVYVLRRGGV